MKIAVASPPIVESAEKKMQWLESLVKEAGRQGAVIICFPESYLPGYPGMAGYEKLDRSEDSLNAALTRVCAIAAENNIMIICPMDKYEDGNWLNVACVISEKGEVMGYQTKNQLDPSEDTYWVPGTQRQLFECGGVPFGITICHEGFRYPESVRWAAQRGAKIVFHPHFTYTENRTPLTEWGHHHNPYYEKAMMLRAMENTIYYAGSNYASEYSDAASSIIAPDGTCIGYEKYGTPGVTVGDIDLNLATGLLAKRYNGTQYREG